MAEKKTKKVTAKSKKVTKAVIKTKKELAVSEPKTNFFSKVSLPKISKLPEGRTRYIILGVIVLSVLAFLSARYLVVAWVDGKPVTRIETYQELDKRYGKDIMEELVVEKLLLSEADKKGVSVNPDEVNAEIKKIEDQQGGSDQLSQVLAAQGITRDDLNKLIKLQLLRQTLFGKDVKVTTEDVDKYIEDNKQQLPEINDQLKKSINDQLMQQKVNTNFNNWLNEAVKSSRVIRI